jgi:hypothetical protein
MDQESSVEKLECQIDCLGITVDHDLRGSAVIRRSQLCGVLALLLTSEQNGPFDCE